MPFILADHVFPELIKPAESDKSPVAATQALVDGMKKVSSDDFLVSSVFCLIEAQDLMDHFKLENKDGHEVEETNQRVTFTGGLSDYFHRESSAVRNFERSGANS